MWCILTWLRIIPSGIFAVGGMQCLVYNTGRLVVPITKSSRIFISKIWRPWIYIGGSQFFGATGSLSDLVQYFFCVIWCVLIKIPSDHSYPEGKPLQWILAYLCGPLFIVPRFAALKWREVSEYRPMYDVKSALLLLADLMENIPTAVSEGRLYALVGVFECSRI
jgi:hypothetical protein